MRASAILAKNSITGFYPSHIIGCRGSMAEYHARSGHSVMDKPPPNREEKAWSRLFEPALLRVKISGNTHRFGAGDLPPVRFASCCRQLPFRVRMSLKPHPAPVPT